MLPSLRRTCCLQSTIRLPSVSTIQLFTGPSAFTDFAYDPLNGDGVQEFHAIPLDDYDLGGDYR